MYLIVDTETSGFYKDNLPLEHPNQGRVIQLAALLLDKEFREEASFSVLIKPTTWVISPGAEAVHHITMKTCEDFGIPIKEALSKLNNISKSCIMIVAHNWKFDGKMLEKEGFIHDLVPFCTMTETTSLCRLPSKRGAYKWPKLTEALNILLGEDLVDAHDAMADCRGCAKLFRYLKQKNTVAV